MEDLLVFDIRHIAEMAAVEEPTKRVYLPDFMTH